MVTRFLNNTYKSICCTLVLLLSLTMSHPLFATTLGAGGYHSCMIKNDGSLTCWGLNDGRIIPPEGQFTQLSVGWDHTCALRTDAALLCWGRTGKDSSVPMMGSIFQLGAGNGYTCVLKSDGTLACWGDSQLAPPAGTFTQISTGWHHACGIRTDGTVACWGNDDYQQASPPEGTFLQVSANGYHSCGIKSDSTVACWGNTSRTPAGPPNLAFTQVAAGFWYTCGIKNDGTLACWGENNYSQAVPPPGTFAQISVGYQHACGLKPDGTVTCWGDNGKEQALPPRELTTHCAYSLDSANFSYSATASTGTVTVTASADFCTWTGSSQTDWLRITSIETAPGLAVIEGPPVLKGNGRVTYTVAANSSEQFRVGRLLIAGQPVTISQWSNAALPVVTQAAFTIPAPAEQITTESLPLSVQSFSDQIHSQTFPITPSKHIYGLSITGQFQLQMGTIATAGGLGQLEEDPAALVRVVLIDNDTQAEYLVYEKSLHTLTPEEATSSLSLYIDKVCEETCILPQPLNSFSLRLSVRQAALSISELSSVNAPIVADIEALQAQQQATKIWQLNEQNLGWIAGETAVSKLSYADKKQRFGSVADLGEFNLQGLEYYRGGVFQMAPPAVSTRSNTRQPPDHSLVKNFNWADKHHGKDCWVTSVKNQTCKNDWAFASAGALEAVANLYFNQCLNLDLAEAATLSCSGAGSCAGGVASAALDYFQTTGIIEEACFPMSGTAPQCQNQCSKPQELLQTSGRLPIDSPEFPRTEEAIKRLLIENGPLSASVNSLGHLMTLVGFKEDPTDGQTIWIFKNSWGTAWGAKSGGWYYGSEWGEYGKADEAESENGYVYLKLPIDDFGSDTNVIKTPILSQRQPYEILCEDVDQDGYCNWGISTDQPDTCPASCQPERDCDDSNPELTTFDANYHCTGNQLPLNPPIALFTATPQKGFMPLEVTLDASGSRAPDGTLAVYEWTIDGQPVEFNDSLTYTFEKPGQFEVTLTVTDPQGLTATTKKMITVVDKYPPVANFTVFPADTGEVPFKVTLNARSSYDPDGNIVSYLWSSSEGHTATGPTATMTFTLPGTYRIALTVTDNDNLTGQFQRDLLTTVKQYSPVAKFTVSPANTGEVPFKVTLNAKNSYDPDGEVVNYHWQSSDGQTATGQKAGMTFTQPGSYTITLTVTDNHQLTGQLQQEVVTVVKQLLPPTAQFSLVPAKTGEAPFKVTLNAKDSADSDGDIVNYQWSSSDGQTAAGQTATITFAQPGSYTISLIVTDADNLTGEFQQEVLVKAKQYPPVAHFTLSPDNTGEVPLQILLNASQSADPDGHLVMYQWFSSDGQTASGENAILIFTHPGSHRITLTVTDNDNLTSEMQQEVIAKAKPNPPVADFTLSPANRGEAPFNVTLDARGSSDSDGQIVDYQWQSSDRQTAAGPTTVLTFQRPGSYRITLTVTDNDNLTQPVEKEVIVTAPPRREGECFYTITPTIMVHSAESETGTFTVTAPPQCAWTVNNYAWWIKITAGESGQGDGTITYSVDGNHNTCTVCAGPFLPPDQRSTTLTIAGETVTVVQKGETDSQVEVADCTYTVSPTSVSHSAEIETGIITVTAPGNCPWTAISNHRWIKITSAENGQGNGTVTYSVESNDNFCTVCTGPFLPPSERSGTLIIARQTVTIHQMMGINKQTEETEEFETLVTSEVEQEALAAGDMESLAVDHLERVTVDSDIDNLQPAVVAANPLVSQTVYQLGDTLRVTLPTVPAGPDQYVGISYPNGTLELLNQFNSFIPFDHVTFPVWSGGDVAIEMPVTVDLPSGLYTIYLLRMPIGVSPLSMKMENWALGVTVFTVIGSH